MRNVDLLGLKYRVYDYFIDGFYLSLAMQPQLSDDLSIMLDHDKLGLLDSSCQSKVCIQLFRGMLNR